MKKDKLKKYGIISLFVFIALVVVKYYKDRADLDKDYRYCIGRVYGYNALSNQGTSLYFRFNVNGINYDSDQITYGKVLECINKRFFVEFSPINPKNNKLLLDKPVKDTRIVQPPEGWKFLPE